MDLIEKINKNRWRLGIDFFRHEARNFERDIEVVVSGTLSAGLKQLKTDFDKRSDTLQKRIDRAKDEDQRDWLIDDGVNLRDEYEDQERFLHNMATVALLARLAHTLNHFVRLGGEFAPKTQAKYEGESEFTKLWREFQERFGIKLGAKHIQWIEPLRRARNLVIHNGGQANPIKNDTKSAGKTKGEERDDTFSKKYRKFVEGKDFSAQVRINESQLKFALKKAVDLTNWLAQEMRAKQLESADKAEKIAKAKKTKRTSA